MAVFNAENTAHKTGDYPLFLGQQMGMYDSINKKYPQLFELYKKQKEQDWAEDEVDLSQSISDFVTCSKSTYDVMVQTLMWQWEADSVAARSIICLFSPFITNSELFTLLMKQSEIEVLHALTYSEIVRQCLPNAREIIEEIQENQNVLSRSGVIVKYMQELEIIGAKYRLDPSSVEEDIVRKCILRALLHF
ncbi:ribonucleotide-diphosphate reductase subunit beta [Escherichia coli]|nr:ribonucleotide-diphosphate reductase subunit beta [Escherichia coli]